MPALTNVLGSPTAITLDLNQLALSDTFLVGVQSAQVTAAADVVDVLINVDPITAGAVAPAVGDRIQIYVYGADTSFATTAWDAIDGTASTAGTEATLTHAAVLNAMSLAVVHSATAATANYVYYTRPFTLAQHFGGVLPDFWGIWVAQNMGGDLKSTTNDTCFSYQTVTPTSSA